MEPSEVSITKPIVVVAGVLALCSLLALFALDYYLFSRPEVHSSTGSWLVAALAAPVYLLLQFFAEGVASAYVDARSRWVKAIPVVAMLVFYAAWLWLRL